MPSRPLSLAEVQAFLDARAGWMALSTLGRDGFPHTVPIGYFRLGEDIYMGCRAASQKIRNIERDPRVSCMLAADRPTGQVKGVLIQGIATVIVEDGERLHLSREAARLRGVPEDELPATVSAGSAYIRVRPTRVISWDFSTV